MENTETYETFGREVYFQEITPIKEVHQPGILSKSRFFDIFALGKMLDKFCFLSPKKEILVYFRHIAGGISPKNPSKERKWWETIQEFKSIIGDDFPAGCEMEYFYGPDHSATISPELKEKSEEPYQAFIKLFNNAIQGFSCFVWNNKEGIGFGSERTNYGTTKPGEAFIHDDLTLWKGTPEELSSSSTRLYHVIKQMEGKYNIGFGGNGKSWRGGDRGEVRIIIPNMGALIGSIVKDSSVTLFIDHSSLENIVEKHNKRYKRDSLNMSMN